VTQLIEMSPNEAGRTGSVREAKSGWRSQKKQGQPEVGQLEARETEAELPWLETPRREEQVPLKAGRKRYPDIDPLNDNDAPWINGAIKLIPHLAEAIPAKAIPNRDAIICTALELIPPLVEGVLELPNIPEQRLIEVLLKYCGYRDYADRVSRHSGQTAETTFCTGREDGFEVGCDVTIGSDVGATALPNSGTTAAVTPFVKDIEVMEVADVK
jgi:hypothetical protein